MVFCESERLVIRKIREDDFDQFCDFLIDTETCLMMGRDIITDRESARPTFDWLKDQEARGFALVLKDGNRVIGNLTVSEVHHLDDCEAVAGKRGAALSFSLGRPWRRQGLMEEAIRAVMAELFRQGYDYVNCGNFDYNTASAALQEKLGFHEIMVEEMDVEGDIFVLYERILWKEEFV